MEAYLRKLDELDLLLSERAKLYDMMDPCHTVIRKLENHICFLLHDIRLMEKKILTVY